MSTYKRLFAFALLPCLMGADRCTWDRQATIYAPSAAGVYCNIPVSLVVDVEPGAAVDIIIGLYTWNGSDRVKIYKSYNATVPSGHLTINETIPFSSITSLRGQSGSLFIDVGAFTPRPATGLEMDVATYVTTYLSSYNMLHARASRAISICS